MAALRSSCGHYILPCGFFYLSFVFFYFFLAWSQRSQSGCLPYFYTWCRSSANLECRSDMCCTRLTGNTGRKNDAKNRHLGTIAQLCRAESSQLRHVSTIGKKNLLSSNMSSTCPYNMANSGPLRINCPNAARSTSESVAKLNMTDLVHDTIWYDALYLRASKSWRIASFRTEPNQTKKE